MMNNKYEGLFQKSELRRCLRGGPRNFRLLVFILVFLLSTASVLAQGSTPGQGYGAIATDAAFNISIGTSTTQSNTKFLLVASSTGSSDFSLKILQSSQTPVFFVRNDGGISIGTTTVTAGQLTIQGNIYSTGSFLNGGVQATQLVPGLFGGASNYAFPSGLGISTTSASLPSGVVLAAYGTSTFFGNVGIGTTAPSQALDVVGTVKASVSVIIGNGYDVQWSDTTTRIIGLAGASGYLALRTNGAESMRIASSGIGIGTSTPIYPLDVVSTAGTRTVAAVRNTATGDPELYLEIPGAVGYAVGIDNSDSDKFKISKNVALETNTYVTIDGSGNVGIGTAAPVTMFEVLRAGQTIAYPGYNVATINFASVAAVGGLVTTLNLHDTSAMAADVGGGIGFGGIYTSTTTAATWAGIYGRKDNATAGDYAGYMSFYTRSNGSIWSEQMRINSSGNVGIGTTQPSSTLHVVGGLRVTTNATTTNLSITGLASTGNPCLSISSAGAVSTSTCGGGSLTGAGTVNYLAYWTTATNIATSTFYQNGTTVGTMGGLGVGTTSAQTAGNVYATNNFLNGSVQATQMVPGLFGGASNYAFPSGLGISTTSASLPSGVALAVYGTSTFFGNVGIGTTGPGLRLDVIGGGLTLSGTASRNFRAIQDQTNYKGIGLGYDTSGQIGVIYSDTPSAASAMAFWTYNGSAWGERMRIDTGGNVGIGTTQPSSTLHVVGDVRITGSASTTNFAITSLTGQSCLGTDAAGKLQAGSCGGSSQWTSASGGIYYPSRVSVGTSTLGTYALLVATSSDNLFAIKREGAAYPTIFKQGTDGALVINNSSTDTLTLKGGNVGIGTTGPSGLGSGGTFTTVQIHNAGTDTFSFGMLNLTSAATGNNSILGALQFGSTGLSGTEKRVAMITGVKTDALTVNPVGELRFFTANGGVPTVKMLIDETGNVGIGTTTVATLFTVATSSPIFNVLSNGYVGIGMASPAYPLDVGGNSIVRGSINLQNNLNAGLRYSSFISNSGEAALYYTTSGGTYPFTVNGNLVIQPRTSAAYDIILATGSTTPAPRVVILGSNGYVGIGTTTPSYGLDVVSGGSTTARFGTVAGDTVVIGGASGKLNVGTIDPIYTIGGQRYATYLPAMTGQKEETTGAAHLRRLTQTDTQTNAEIYGYTIDFNNLEKGSDLWLFSKTTDLKDNFDKMTVLLTPSFDGRVWYEKDRDNLRLTVYGVPRESASSPRESAFEVSYRLSAPRFDAASWPNTSTDSSAGFIINEK